MFSLVQAVHINTKSPQQYDLILEEGEGGGAEVF